MTRISSPLLVLLLSIPVFANNVYVAQSAAGSANGTSCANAYSVATLDAGWSGKINPGDTLYICGNITSQLQVLGSGTAGNLITVTSDPTTNGKFAAPNWDSVIPMSMGNLSYVRITGITFIATSPTVSTTGQAMSVGSCSNCEIDHNVFGPFSSRTQTNPGTCSNNTCNLVGLSIDGGGLATTNLTIDHNQFTYWGQAVQYSWGNGTTNFSFNNNYCHQVGSCIWVASGYNNAVITGVSVNNNELFDLSEFSDSSDSIHCDGLIHAHVAVSGTIINGLQIYNNYIHGPTCVHSGTSNTTTWVFIENNFGPSLNHIPSPLVYNNLIYTTGSSAGVTDGNIFFKYTYAGVAYNNTVYPGGGTGINLQGVTGQTIRNNIIDQGGSGYGVCVASCEGSGTTGVVEDHDDFYASSEDITLGTATITTNPLLNTDGSLQSGSPAIGSGANLTSSCSGTSLCSDRLGSPRPASGAWDMGAYQYTSTAQAPAPPSNLQAAIN